MEEKTHQSTQRQLGVTLFQRQQALRQQTRWQVIQLCNKTNSRLFKWGKRERAKMPHVVHKMHVHIALLPVHTQKKKNGEGHSSTLPAGSTKCTFHLETKEWTGTNDDFFSPLRRFILQPWQSILLLYSKDIWLFVGLYRELWKRCWQPLRRKGQSQLRSGLSESDHFQIGLPSKGQAMMRSAINIQHEIIRFWWKVAVISVWSFFFVVCLVKLIPVITAEDCKVYLWMNGYMAN